MKKTQYSDDRDQSAETYEPRRNRYKPKKEKKSQKKKSWINELFSTILYIAFVFVLFLLIRHFLFAPVSVDGESMFPTLEDQDRLILNKIEQVDRFDVIVFPSPGDPEKQYIKRVIGLPGDEIMVSDDVLYINGEAVDEWYLDPSQADLSEGQSFTEDFTLASRTGFETVPEGSYFVLGDNRINSRDSRYFGFIDADDVIGTTSLRIWPFNSFGFIESE